MRSACAVARPPRTKAWSLCFLEGWCVVHPSHCLYFFGRHLTAFFAAIIKDIAFIADLARIAINGRAFIADLASRKGEVVIAFCWRIMRVAGGAPIAVGK